MAGELGRDGRGLGQPSAHHGGRRGTVERLGPELLAEHLVDLAHRDPEAVGLAGEVAADLVGVQVGLREQVAGTGQGQLPAVAGGAQELLQHRELDRLPSPAVGGGASSTQP